MTERITSKEHPKFYLRDSENSMMYYPNDMYMNKYFGTLNKVVNMHDALYFENKEKYLNEYHSRFNA